MIVVVRPLGRNSWSGFSRYKNCTEYLGTYYTRSGALYTGLTPEDAERLGNLLGLDLRPSSAYWESFVIPMTGKDLYLDTSYPSDELKYLFLKNHKRVQASISEVKPGANYVMIDKTNEAKEANKFNRIKRRAAVEFEKMSLDDMRKCLRLYGYNSESSSAEIIESTLYDLIEGNPERFLDKWVDNKDRELYVLLETAISKNIIRKSGGMYRYGGEILGNSKDGAVAYLKNPTNQDIRVAIDREVAGKPEFSMVDRSAEINEEEESPAAKAISKAKKLKKQEVSDEADVPNELLVK